MQQTQEGISKQQHIVSVKPALKTGPSTKKLELEKKLGIKKYELIGCLVQNGFSMSDDIVSRLDSTTNLGVEKNLIEILGGKVAHMEVATTLIREFQEIADEIDAEERK